MAPLPLAIAQSCVFSSWRCCRFQGVTSHSSQQCAECCLPLASLPLGQWCWLWPFLHRQRADSDAGFTSASCPRLISRMLSRVEVHLVFSRPHLSKCRCTADRVAGSRGSLGFTGAGPRGSCPQGHGSPKTRRTWQLIWSDTWVVLSHLHHDHCDHRDHHNQHHNHNIHPHALFALGNLDVHRAIGI